MKKILLLKNVNVSKLKSLLNITANLIAKEEALNIEVDGENLGCIATNSQFSVYKKWNVDLSTICETVSEKDSKIKLSIYQVNDFIKTLELFGQLVNIEIQYVDDSAKKLVLYKTDDKGDVVVEISVLTADTEISFNEMDESTVDSVFNPSEDKFLDTFVINYEDIKNVTKMIGVKSNPEEQKEYVTIYTDNGNLMVTDNGWKTKIGVTDKEIKNKIEIDKDLWKSIDTSDNYFVSLYQIDNGEGDLVNTLLFKALNTDLKIAMVLLKDVDESIDFNNFEAHYSEVGFD